VRWVIAAIAGFGLLGSAASAAAKDEWDAPQPAWEGVWRGTIGTLPVHVCLDHTPYTEKGAYYYDRSKHLLRLVRGKAEGEWFEQETDDKNGARWRLTAKGGELAGTWSEGRKSLPVRLARIGGPSRDYDGPCGSMAFHRPRIGPVRLTATAGVKDGNRFTTWTFKPSPWLSDEVAISTFTLDRPGAAIARVNTILRSVLPKRDATGEWLECVAGNANTHGSDGSFYQAIEPQVISNIWLGANENGEYYCGGPHPENFNHPRTFHLGRGVEVDPRDWFLPSAVKREDLGGNYGLYKTLTPAFVAMILEEWKPGGDEQDQECRDATLTQESWSVGIARGALVFSPNFPRVIMACGDDYKVPFAKLQPWLNAKGKAAVATLPR